MLTYLPLLSVRFAEKNDKQAVLSAGMTEQEAEAWSHIAESAKLLLELTEMHTADKREIAEAIHIIQQKLLARPTYRKYLAFYKKE